MPSRIFLSYRYSEAAKDARALYEHLRVEFGEDGVFLDRKSIPPGEDFVANLTIQLDACDVLLALVGPDWARKGKTGRRRLDDENDFVRTELTTALRRGIRVIPILIDGACMPSSDQLPDELKGFSRLNAVPLEYDHFDADLTMLVAVLRKLLHEGKRREPVGSLLPAAVAAANSPSAPKTGQPLAAGLPCWAAGKAPLPSRPSAEEMFSAGPSFEQLKNEFMRKGLSEEDAGMLAVEEQQGRYNRMLSMLTDLLQGQARKGILQNLRA